MKTKNLRLPYKSTRIFMILLLMLVSARCMGPAGPRGSNGTNGIDGINYTHSAIYDIAASDWVGDLNGYDVVINVPEITEDIYNNGAVLVYRLVEIEPKSFNLLPYSYVDNSTIIYMDFDAYVGSIDLIYKEVHNGVNATPAPQATISFKVVIIEGIHLATLKGMVDIRDYSAVAKMLDIDKCIDSVK